MLTNEEQLQLAKSLKINRIVWLAIFLSLPVYLLIAVFLDREKLISPDFGFSVTTVGIFLLVVSAVTLFLTFLIRKKLLETRSSSIIVPDVAGKPLSLIQHAGARYSGAVIISLALSESIGIYGFVSFLLLKELVLFCEFLFLSAVGMVIYRPRKDELMEFANRLKKRRTTSRDSTV